MMKKNNGQEVEGYALHTYRTQQELQRNKKWDKQIEQILKSFGIKYVDFTENNTDEYSRRMDMEKGVDVVCDGVGCGLRINRGKSYDAFNVRQYRLNHEAEYYKRLREIQDRTLDCKLMIQVYINSEDTELLSLAIVSTTELIRSIYLGKTPTWCCNNAKFLKVSWEYLTKRTNKIKIWRKED